MKAILRYEYGSPDVLKFEDNLPPLITTLCLTMLLLTQVVTVAQDNKT